ncbi:MAG: DNA repair exonuclease [Gemmatimonadota bacterium]|nr:DNA repair exonuclease [Gemmatimonadota bacterium]
MRLVHLADLHLGFRQYHRLTPAGTNQREADVDGTFARAIDRVIAIEPDAVLIAGDVFHSVRPRNQTIIHAFSQLAKLRQTLPEAFVVMIAGNHDQPRAMETGCILALFRELGIDVVQQEAERMAPRRGLSILAVPDSQTPLPELLPDPRSRHNVLLLHGEVEGVLPPHVPRVERASIEIPKRDLHAEQWSYIALGHYHVHRAIAPNTFYSGSLDYTSTNPWAELVEERALGLPGKGFIEYDLDAGRHTFHSVPPSRTLLDLPPLQARGLSAAEVDAAIRDRVDGIDGGIDDKITRLVIRDIPRHVVRDLDHKAIREYKRRALNFQLDPRRPEVPRISLEGAPGRRPTLPETIRGYLERRPLESDIDREALIRLGLQYLYEADARENGGAGTVTTGGSGEP